MKSALKISPYAKFHPNWLNIEETDQIWPKFGPKNAISGVNFAKLLKFLKSAPEITPKCKDSCKSAKYQRNGPKGRPKLGPNLGQ